MPVRPEIDKTCIESRHRIDNPSISVINFQQLEKIEENLEDKVLKKMRINEMESVEMTSIPTASADGQALAEMVKTGKHYVNIGGIQVINGLVLSQFELQASHGNHIIRVPYCTF